MSEFKFKTTNIRGKEYVEVNQRILYFRQAPEYAGWTIESEVFHLDESSCVIKAIIRDDQGRARATGFAQEDRTSSNINKTSYVENCETSAWGRALACLGVGIETSIASSNEVSMAIAKQERSATEPSVDIWAQAVDYMKSSKNKAGAYERIISKYGDDLSDKQKEGLQKFVK